MPNISIALTGLQADTIALNTIGNNLANLNTTAFKAQTTTFSDLFYQQIGTSGTANSLQVGVGTRVSGTATDFSQGTLATTTTSTDMALDGSGFFLVDRGNTESLTRAGNFQLDATGNLLSSSGENVMGYGVSNGTVNVNGGLMAMQLPVTQNEPAHATSNISLTTSLDSTAATGATYSSSVSLYDSLGLEHSGTVTFTKASATSWNYAVTLPAGDASGTPVGNTGTLTFNSSGQLTSPTSNVSGITFPGMADGAQALNFSMNLYGSTGSPLISQTAGTSNTSSTTQDGYAAGAYQSFAVGLDGTLSATFSNGQTTTVGQVAVAQVANEAGLTRAGSNDYITSDASGLISVGLANVGGRGSVEGESLEQSNVDISSEFSNLIIAQRAFEANSKTVTTFDSVTQEAIGMIR
jgi:flagellar hook protein FlgE